jgi:hypothetical protein
VTVYICRWEQPIAGDKEALAEARDEAMKQVQQLKEMLRTLKEKHESNIQKLDTLEREFRMFKDEAVAFINERIVINFCEQLHSERRKKEISAQIAALQVRHRGTRLFDTVDKLSIYKAEHNTGFRILASSCCPPHDMHLLLAHSEGESGCD